MMADVAGCLAVGRQDISRRTPKSEPTTWGCGSVQRFNCVVGLSSDGHRADSALGGGPRRTGQDLDSDNMGRVLQVLGSGPALMSAAWLP